VIKNQDFRRHSGILLADFWHDYLPFEAAIFGEKAAVVASEIFD
jgi:hypothetical protein